jgi:hypothetical protein
MVATSHPGRASDAGSDTEVFECQVCGFPVERTAGFLAVDILAAQEAMRGEAYPARWEPTHGPCCDTSAFYAIELADLANPRRILWWNAHLRAKNWTRFTDWDRFMAREGRYF